jgi:hypothetical protein
MFEWFRWWRSLRRNESLRAWQRRLLIAIFMRLGQLEILLPLERTDDTVSH